MVVNAGAVAYSARERFWLAVLAVAGFGGLNGAFVWAMLVHPEMALSAYQNPVSAAFMVEAFILVGVLAYLLRRWRVSTVNWVWFVLLSLLGGIAFSLPVVLLWTERRSSRTESPLTVKSDK